MKETSSDYQLNLLTDYYKIPLSWSSLHTYHQEHLHQGSAMFYDTIVRGSVQVCSLASHSVIQQTFTEPGLMTSPAPSVRDTEGKETDENPCPHGASILVGKTESRG